jgi:hypothetical protein
VLRAVLAVAAVVASLLGALVAAFIAAITWSGCFIACTGENHAGGAALGVLAVLILAAGPVVVKALYSGAAWLRTAGWVGAGVLVVLALGILVG